ncbi:hypothetical protein FGB62_169g014 [Gracilaria domingensis]|nr:hypothetical protein FGB62_169g014 [Gracilaria domingensis]
MPRDARAVQTVHAGVPRDDEHVLVAGDEAGVEVLDGKGLEGTVDEGGGFGEPVATGVAVARLLLVADVEVLVLRKTGVQRVDVVAGDGDDVDQAVRQTVHGGGFRGEVGVVVIGVVEHEHLLVAERVAAHVVVHDGVVRQLDVAGGADGPRGVRDVERAQRAVVRGLLQQEVRADVRRVRDARGGGGELERARQRRDGGKQQQRSEAHGDKAGSERGGLARRARAAPRRAAPRQLCTQRPRRAPRRRAGRRGSGRRRAQRGRGAAAAAPPRAGAARAAAARARAVGFAIGGGGGGGGAAALARHWRCRDERGACACAPAGCIAARRPFRAAADVAARALGARAACGNRRAAAATGARRHGARRRRSSGGAPAAARAI